VAAGSSANSIAPCSVLQSPVDVGVVVDRRRHHCPSSVDIEPSYLASGESQAEAGFQCSVDLGDLLVGDRPDGRLDPGLDVDDPNLAHVRDGVLFENGVCCRHFDFEGVCLSRCVFRGEWRHNRGWGVLVSSVVLDDNTRSWLASLFASFGGVQFDKDDIAAAYLHD
jgi:hypothetical protein